MFGLRRSGVINRLCPRGNLNDIGTEENDRTPLMRSPRDPGPPGGRRAAYRCEPLSLRGASTVTASAPGRAQNYVEFMSG